MEACGNGHFRDNTMSSFPRRCRTNYLMTRRVSNLYSLHRVHLQPTSHMCVLEGLNTNSTCCLLCVYKILLKHYTSSKSFSKSSTIVVSSGHFDRVEWGHSFSAKSLSFIVLIIGPASGCSDCLRVCNKAITSS